MKIPKIIHQIWVGDKPVPVKALQTWKDKHPDYVFMMWDNETVKNKKWRCQHQLDQMWQAGRFNGVSDIIRYEVLFEYGGFVAPADSVCVNPIDDLLDYGCFCCYENEKARPDLLSPHLGSFPSNQFINFIIGTIANSPDVIYADPWKITGNALLTGAVKLLKYGIVILPSYTFIPEHYSGEKYQGNGKIYARHLWGTTKNITGNLDDYVDEK